MYVILPLAVVTKSQRNRVTIESRSIQQSGLYVSFESFDVKAKSNAGLSNRSIGKSKFWILLSNWNNLGRAQRGDVDMKEEGG